MYIKKVLFWTSELEILNYFKEFQSFFQIGIVKLNTGVISAAKFC